MLKCLLLREVSEVCIFQQTRLANAYLKRGFLESIGLWGDEVSHIPIRKVTAHLLEGLLWTGVYCRKLTGVWIDWAQQATSQCSVWLLSTAEFCEASFRGKFSSENGSQLLYSWSEPPIHSQHECYSFIDNSVHEFSLVTSCLWVIIHCIVCYHQIDSQCLEEWKPVWNLRKLFWSHPLPSGPQTDPFGLLDTHFTWIVILINIQWRNLDNELENTHLR